MEYPLKLSIVIINYKTVELTEACLKSIFNPQSGFHKLGGEVILIDNASDDGCDEMVKKYPHVKFVSNTTNRGFSGANNQGIDYSRGEYVLLLNSDTECRPNSLAELVKAADELGGRAITAGKLFFPDGSRQDSAFYLPTVRKAFEEYFLGRTGSYFMYQPQVVNPVRVEGAVMACFMIPRAVINKIGYLDEGTFMYFEDVEYCRRASLSAVPIYFVPKAEFVHHHGASSKKIGQEKSYELLKKGSRYYHGAVKYWLLWAILWLGQRIGKTKSPTSRWTL
jgi:GT2 family glycosyltransferase